MNKNAFQTRVALNAKRMSDSIYQIENIFQPDDYQWPGDWEGRALLAFVCLYRITGNKIPCMDKLVEMLPQKTNGYGFFGKKYKDYVNEQQLSGHSWYLRGLLAYEREFHNSVVQNLIESTFENLYYPALNGYANYPMEQRWNEKGYVSGSNSDIINGWEVSTDIGCAFMAVDGVSDYYEYSKNPKAKKLMEVMIDACMRFDRKKNFAQTHATLSAARGIIRFYKCTGEEKYLKYAKQLFTLYINDGMTLSYENLNWFGRPLWTEPCCIVDSLLLATEFYKLTGESQYATLAKRIFHNGMAFCQRSNGGAGTDSCVSKEEPFLYTGVHYEAIFCCTMRFSEGLLCAWQNQDLLFEGIDLSKPVIKDETNRYFCGNILLCEDCSTENATADYLPEATFKVDGHMLIPIVALYKIPEEKATKVKLKIIF